MRTAAVFSLAIAVMAAACSSKPAGAFPETITFAGRTLTKGSDWTRGGLSAIVYVPPGEKLPEAATQIGAIVSTEHTTARQLHDWITNESLQAVGPPFYSSGEPGEVCKVHAQHLPGGVRTYLALQVCKTGVGRAACVEADEAIDQSEVTVCIGSSAGAACRDLCDRRWMERREALDLLAADILSRR